jgi:hypothetical protein
MDPSEVDALQRRLDPLFRTHLRFLAADPLEEEMYRRQVETMTPERRSHLVARIAAALGGLTEG